MATPLWARLATLLMLALSALMSAEEARPRLEREAVARSPPASEVTS